MDVMDILVIIGVVMMMLAQMCDVVMDVFVFLIRVLRVSRRGGMGDSFVDGLVVSVHVMMAQIFVVAVVVVVMMMMMMVTMIAVMSSVMVVVISARVVKIVLFGDFLSIWCNVFA